MERRSRGVGVAAHWLSMRGLLATANPAAAEVGRLLARFSATSLPLLLEGETGSGKSFLAAKVHRRSRPGRPLVVVDCGAVPASLAAAELFGHGPGAFTDATRARRGRLEQAGDGTLVLDRIETLPAEGQMALLRVLESQRFVPLGSTATRPLRARVVATATADVGACLEDGRLRRDLYHRLAGVHVRIPPLRARPEDILPATLAFLRRQSRRMNRSFTLAPECAELLRKYPWPGNFRELEGALTRACLTAEGGVVRPENLSLPAHSWPAIASWAVEQRRCLAEVTRLYALWVLAQEGGNVSRAARVLGVSRRTLIRWRGQRHE